ncbi:MAG: MFS transporter, partial [Candidatus Nanohaloarchaea archaeon]|nr:MFS transporter [Candidatus Nanohaloarchaea archaeon]
MVPTRPVFNGEQIAVLMLSATHGMQHFFGRIFPPLIPLLATDLQLPLWKLGLVVTLWSVANGASQAPLGHLADRVDRRFILPTGVAVVGLGYLIVAASPVLAAYAPAISLFGVTWSSALTVVTAGMVVAGLGRGATHPAGYPLLTANVVADHKGKALGWWGSASKLGDAAGPAFVGVALLLFAWETVFLLIAGIGIIYAAALFVYMTTSRLETVPDNGNGDESGDASGYWTPVLLVLAAFIGISFASRGIGTYLPAFITDVYGFSFTVLDITFRPESVASMYFSLLLLAGAVSIAAVGRLVDRYDPRLIMITVYLAATAARRTMTLLRNEDDADPLSPDLDDLPGYVKPDG